MRAVLAVAAAGLVLVACGAEDSGPSKAEYIERADAICAKIDPKVDAALLVAIDEDDPSEAQGALEAALPLERQMLVELRALEKPDEGADEIDRIWAARQKVVDAAQAASRDPDAALAFIAREGDGDKLFNEQYLVVAGEYGMVMCGESRPTLNGQPRG